MVAFNIMQFFPSLNHDVLMAIIAKSGFPLVMGNFFKSYLVGCKTMYKWDDFLSGFFAVDIGVSQGSGLSPVLSGLYLALDPIVREVQILSYICQWWHLTGTESTAEPQLTTPEDGL